MSDPKSDPLALGAEELQGTEGFWTKIELAAAAASLIWVVGALVYMMILADAGTASWLWRAIAVALPLALIWTVALTCRLIRDLRREAEELQNELIALRQSHVQLQKAAALRAPERKAAEPAPPAPKPPAPKAAASDPAAMAAQIATPSAPIAAEAQTSLAFAQEPEAPQPVMRSDEFVRALNFPEDPDDAEGIRCLRLALTDRDAARLIRSTQDVLTLLAQDGIYMDDLRPEHAKPEVWRRFAQGERGRGVSALGGIRDRSSLALTSNRMRSDMIFRDAGHHFLRQFDRSLQAFEKNATEADLAEFADTRTARVFMLLARVTGVFD